jgi:hypothetical protein
MDHLVATFIEAETKLKRVLPGVIVLVNTTVIRAVIEL